MRGQRFEEVLRNCREGSPLDLTPEELAEGWPYCPEFDGQLTLQRMAGRRPWCGCSQLKGGSVEPYLTTMTAEGRFYLKKGSETLYVFTMPTDPEVRHGVEVFVSQSVHLAYRQGLADAVGGKKF